MYDHAWRKVRAEVLRRDGHNCRVRLKGCQGKANHVDHIIPVEAGGARLDPANLRAACEHCNKSRAASEKHRNGWRRARTQIVLVVGPPGGGKSTYVSEHAEPGDLVVDWDRIAEAFGSPTTHGASGALADVAHRARGTVLTQLRRGELDTDRAWIVSANPGAESIFPHHDVVVVDPGREQAIRQAVDAGRPASWLGLIEDWYAARCGALVGGPTSRAW